MGLHDPRVDDDGEAVVVRTPRANLLLSGGFAAFGIVLWAAFLAKAPVGALVFLAVWTLLVASWLVLALRPAARAGAEGIVLGAFRPHLVRWDDISGIEVIGRQRWPNPGRTMRVVDRSGGSSAFSLFSMLTPRGREPEPSMAVVVEVAEALASVPVRFGRAALPVTQVED